MAKNLLSKYVWLVDTIYRAGKITFEEINQKWVDEEMDYDEKKKEAKELPLRTFHKWRVAIEEMFDLYIDNEGKGRYCYYIGNAKELTSGSIRSWLFNTLSVSNLLMNPTLSDLIGGIESVTLSDEEAKRRGTQKVVLERRSPPTFDVLVEIRQRNQVVVYQDVAEAVDALVRGIELQPELRTKSSKGQIIREKAPAPVLEGTGFTGNNAPSGEGKKGKKTLSRMQANIVEISGKSKSALTELKQTEASVKAGDPEFHKETVRVYCHGVARNRLNDAAERLDAPVIVVNNLEEADMLMTLRPYYRERQQIIVEAEERGIPIYVLRSNTTTQIEYTLANMLKIEVQEQAVNWEDVEDETISAIRSVLSGEVSWIDLSPADHAIRRIQKEMINEAGLVCQSFGKEPRRRLRIYRG